MSAIAPPPRPTCPPDCRSCGLRKTGAFTPLEPQVLDFIEGFRADTLVVPADIFGSAELSFGPQKRLGSDMSRLSQIQDGRWKPISEYVKP